MITDQAASQSTFQVMAIYWDDGKHGVFVWGTFQLKMNLSVLPSPGDGIVRGGHSPPGDSRHIRGKLRGSRQFIR